MLRRDENISLEMLKGAEVYSKSNVKLLFRSAVTCYPQVKSTIPNDDTYVDIVMQPQHI